MTIRLCAIATNAYTKRLTEAVAAASGGEVEIALHVGRRSDEVRATALTSLRARQGRGGPVMTRPWSGIVRRLMETPDYAERMEEFVDHLHRRSDLNAPDLKAHPLRTPADYADYYHILCDVAARLLTERRITHVVTYAPPHLAYDTVFFHVARAMGLQTLVLFAFREPRTFFSMADAGALGRFPMDPDAAPVPVPRAARPDYPYMAGIRQAPEAGGRLPRGAAWRLWWFLALRRPDLALNPAAMRGMLAAMRGAAETLPKWRDPFARFLHTDEIAYFRALAEHEAKAPDLTGRYVYVPLQFQPEMTTSALGGVFRDQALMVECLADLVPDGVRILVKENPKQRAYMRGPMFFHRLRRIPSVTLVPSWADTHALVGGAEAVATVTGTAGWEAIVAGTPALVFGRAWYRQMPGVTEWRPDLTWDEVTGQRWDHEGIEAAYGALLARAHRGIVDEQYRVYLPDDQRDDLIAGTPEAMLTLLRGEAELSFPG